MSLYTIGEVARKVGVSINRIAYHHGTGRLAEPERFAGDRAYTEEDLARVRSYFETTQKYQRVDAKSNVNPQNQKDA